MAKYTCMHKKYDILLRLKKNVAQKIEKSIIKFYESKQLWRNI